MLNLICIVNKPHATGDRVVAKYMLYTGWGSELDIPSYKQYKNQKFQKHLDKIKNQIRQIKDCSLKDADKQRIFQQIVDEVNNEIKPSHRG